MEKKYLKSLIFIAWPLFISEVISQIQMMIDKMFLGRLDIKNMTALGNVSSPIWTTMSLVFTLAIGTTILASQAMGAGKRNEAYGYICALFKYSSALSIVLFLLWCFLPEPIFRAMGVSESVLELCVAYSRIYSPVFITVGIGAAVNTMLQVEQKTQYLMYYGILRALINIVLDWIMIFGKFGFPAMGIRGAALATTIAEFAGELAVLSLVARDKKISLKPKMKDIFAAKFGLYINSIKLGLPSACEDFAWNFGSMMLIVVLNHVSDVAAGVYSIVFSVELLPICAVAALSSATVTLCGRKTGEGCPKEIGKVVISALAICAILCGTMLVFFIAIPTPILGLFTTDKEVLSMAAIYLIIVGIDLFPKSVNMQVGSGIKGYGNTKWMLGTQIFGTAFVIIMSRVVVYLLHGGIAAIFVVVVADEFIRAVINSFKLKRITA